MGERKPEYNAETPSGEKAGFDISPYLQCMRDHYRRILIYLGAGLLVFLTAYSIYNNYFTWTVVNSAVEVRFLFSGAENGKYPDDDPFSAQELLATSVLHHVYEKNGLKAFVTFHDFQNSLSVAQARNESAAIEADFNSKLNDPKLSSVERDRIVREFREQMASLRNADYRLICNFDPSVIPNAKMQKVLLDIPVEWARQVEQQRGILRYKVDILSPSLVTENSAANEPMVLVDILRDQVAKVLGNIEQISKLPGAFSIRDDKGQDRLQDVKERLGELEAYQLDPLVMQISLQKLAHNNSAVGSYLESRLESVGIQRAEAQANLKNLQDSLTGYLQERRAAPALTTTQDSTTVVPQMTGDVFEKIVALGGRAQDLDYRRRLTDRIIEAGGKLVSIEAKMKTYEKMLAAFRNGAAPAAPSPETFKAFEERLRLMQATVAKCVGQVNSIYDQINNKNLNPEHKLFVISMPPQSYARTFGMQYFRIGASLFWLLVIALGGIWLWAKVREKSGTAHPGEPSPQS